MGFLLLLMIAGSYAEKVKLYKKNLVISPDKSITLKSFEISMKSLSFANMLYQPKNGNDWLINIYYDLLNTGTKPINDHSISDLRLLCKTTDNTYISIKPNDASDSRKDLMPGKKEYSASLFIYNKHFTPIALISKQMDDFLLFSDTDELAEEYKAAIAKYNTFETFIALIQDGKNDELAGFIAEHSINIDGRDRDGFPPVYYAVKNNNNEALSVLVTNKVDANAILATNYFSVQQPLHIAVINKNPAACELLLKGGADAKSLVFLNITPAHWALIQNAHEVLPAFTKYGVDYKKMTFTNKDGSEETALDYAKRNKQQEVIDYITSLK